MHVHRLVKEPFTESNKESINFDLFSIIILTIFFFFIFVSHNYRTIIVTGFYNYGVMVKIP